MLAASQVLPERSAGQRATMQLNQQYRRRSRCHCASTPASQALRDHGRSAARSVAAPRYLLGRVSEARLPTCHSNFQGGNNVKASLGVCFALSRNYVSSYRRTAIMRKKMHATVFSIRYRRGNSPERLHVKVYECAGEMPRLKLGRPVCATDNAKSLVEMIQQFPTTSAIFRGPALTN
jgi:hypothetical protein